MHRLHSAIVRALRNLTLHKFRVLLNLLGLILGVSSVIAMLGITEGARLETQLQLVALGAANTQQAESTQRTYNVVLASIASISLVAGGIGIMNIMLATVSARTREIGIRRASGARRRDIIEQFLIEATVISVAGGLIGVMVGMAVLPLYSQLSGMPVVLRPWTPIIAFLTAVSIGVVFGVYPAHRAATLDPVDALRNE